MTIVESSNSTKPNERWIYLKIVLTAGVIIDLTLNYEEASSLLAHLKKNMD